jgi:hypothetical protein
LADPYRSSRLPDLPTAGYHTRAQRELTDAIMFLIRGMERDRALLLETVIKGRALWRKRFISAFRAIKADETFADAVFGYLELLAGPDPVAQKARLDLMVSQQQVTSWDKRLATKLRLARDHKELEMDILRESLKPRRTYRH